MAAGDGVGAAVAPIVGPDSPLARAGIARGVALRRLERLGIRTVRDLLFHLPRRYDDFSRPLTLRQLRESPPDGPVTATVTIVELDVEQGFRRRVQRTVARIRDETGDGEAIWFGRRYVERRLRPGDTVTMSGRVEVRGWLPRFQGPDFGAADAASLHTGRIVPVYRLTEGVTNPWLRRAIRTALDIAAPRYTEYLPAEAGALLQPPPPAIADALESAHFPADFASRDAALRRLALDELLALQVGMVARDRQRRRSTGEPIHVAPERLAHAVETIEEVLTHQIRDRLARAGGGLPPDAADETRARLTSDQRAAVDAIRADLARERPMLRLLQGDVGSGKTAVAALALAFVADTGRQGALLAPTDLLARQHATTLGRLLEPLGHGVTLLTASLPASARAAALEVIAAPPLVSPDGLTQGRVVVGTHALVQESVAFQELRVAVVDEQHRFGVAQREALGAKGVSPHVLLMTATPIPRTLSQILHADLDVSDLRVPPAGRARVKTGWRRSAELMGTPERPDKGAYPLVAREVRAGHRAFVVVPLVEEDEASGARSADEVARQLRELLPAAAASQGFEFPALAVEVVHGQMKAADRDVTMQRFRDGEVHVLVGTTVLEVGVDVPEATVMIVLDADRFGVAQLHQLRGRVGRGEAESWCVLVSDSDDPAAVTRLRALETGKDGQQLDGFELAEIDLEQRREGELLGLTQSGAPPLRVARLTSRADRELSVAARGVAERFVDDTGRLLPAYEALGAELRHGWLARVGAGELLDERGAEPRDAEEPSVRRPSGTGDRPRRRPAGTDGRTGTAHA